MNQARLELDGESVVFRHGGRGPLLVLNHALGPLAWGPLERLQRSCTVAIPDWERSTLPEDERFVGDWIDAVARELGFEEAALAAWSMAGPAAVAAAYSSRSRAIRASRSSWSSAIQASELRGDPVSPATRFKKASPFPGSQ